MLKMSRLVGLCRVLQSSYARTNTFSTKLLAAVSSVTVSPLQPSGTLGLENRTFSLSARYMKKANTKAKKQKKSKKVLADDDDDEVEIGAVVDMDTLTEEMEQALEHMQKEFIQNVSLRPSTAAYEHLIIETSDGRYPLNQIAQVAIQGPMIIINMAISPQYIKNVEDVLRENLNVNPQMAGTTLTLPVPKITREYRQEMVERVKKIAENSKDVIRHIRSKYVKKLDSIKDVESDDTIFEYSKKIDSKTKLYVDKISTLAAKRSKEINA
ncbi:ribosome-recycling factor, mitochondrial-like [Saccostrea echinata]|uniref:ribosome-recycling factor, mitochondrial-like n=1 Tax=Saccostrea echinata TaxID=191078 RepID=UPI002A820DD5|nr:ribosome-recycling factor, mitochondrial-like [Saccostrea echinata]